MTFLDAIILGIVEGLTEFLPVSSTGHLILASDLLGLDQAGFLSSFEIVIQLGAILAVIVLYFQKLFLDRETMKRVGVALLPALVVGGVFYSSIKRLFESEMTVVITLFLGGVFIVAFEIIHREKEDAKDDVAVLPYRTAFLVGVFQTLSVVPGVSRAGATILGGLFLGMRRKAIVEFSFLLAVPTMVAASTIDLWKNGASFVSSEWNILAAGFVTAFFVAIVAVKFFLRFVESHTFIPFGVYRIIIAGLFLVFIL